MNNMLPTPYQQFIHKSRYARWLDDEQRRENWMKLYSVTRTSWLNHVKDKHNFDMPETDLFEIEQAIIGQEIMPSMRAMMTAGPALARDNICGYNCSYIL